jgi:hypothetical protein
MSLDDGDIHPRPVDMAAEPCFGPRRIALERFRRLI